MKKRQNKQKIVLDNDGKPVTDVKKGLSDFLNQEWNEFIKIRTEIEVLPADEPRGWNLSHPVVEEAGEPELIVIKRKS